MVMRDLQPSAPLDDASGKRVVPLEADGVQGPLGSASLQNQGAGRAVGRVADAAAQHKRLVVGAVADQQPAGGDDHVSPDVGRHGPGHENLGGSVPLAFPRQHPPLTVGRGINAKTGGFGAFKIDLGKGDVLRQQNRLLV